MNSRLATNMETRWHGVKLDVSGGGNDINQSNLTRNPLLVSNFKYHGRGTCDHTRGHRGYNCDMKLNINQMEDKVCLGVQIKISIKDFLT